MAYEGGIGGTIKALWSPDLTTRYGAESAARRASKIFYFLGGLFLLSFSVGAHYSEIIPRILAGDGYLLFFAILAVIMLCAAVLLPRGRGWQVGAVAAFLVGIAVVGSGNFIIWAIGLPFVAASVGGIRGGRALAADNFSDDLYETFA